MTDQVVIACNDDNFEECIKLALKHGTGLEIQSFAQPDKLDGDWQAEVKRYQNQLAQDGFKGLLTMHGAFLDLVSASPDRKVVQLTRERYSANLEIAQAFEAKYVVFHTNFLPMIRLPVYREQWTERQIEFWGEMAEDAKGKGVTILLENMWEYDPALICDVLDTVNSPNLHACIDVGHTFLFSDIVLENWLERMGRHLLYAHLNNNPGGVDYHQALSDGVINYGEILPMLRELPQPPTFCLEIARLDDIERSLPYFELAQAA